MDSRTVTFLVLFISCITAAPVPQKKIALVRNSTFGFALAADGGQTAGVLQGNKDVDITLPGNLEQQLPDITVFENVNSGAGIALGGSISFGVIKDNLFSGRFLPFGK